MQAPWRAGTHKRPKRGSLRALDLALHAHIRNSTPQHAFTGRHLSQASGFVEFSS